MIGEFDYGDDFVGADLHNTAAVYILFGCFMIVMTILVMNLLVGLAVDDIKEIQNKAQLKRLQMQVSVGSGEILCDYSTFYFLDEVY